MSQRTQVLLHFDSKTLLNKTNEKELNILLQALCDNPSTFQFRSPVQWEKFGLINYLKIVKNPMDLQTVKLNLRNELYQSVQQCLEDIQLIWDNSKLYNYGNNWIYDLTRKCQATFHKMIKNYFPELQFNKEKKKDKKKRLAQKQDQPETKPLSENPQDTKNRQEKETIMQEREGDADNFDLNLSLKQPQVDVLRSKFLGRVTKCSYQEVSVIYLMVKNNCIKAVKFDNQGNCCIDAQMLGEELLMKIFEFMDSPKQSKTPKKKVKKNQNSLLSNKKDR